jgi:hypothetical protein
MRHGPKKRHVSTTKLDDLIIENVEASNSCEHYPPVPEQHAYVFQVLISYMGERRASNPVLHKALRVLGHAELFEPVRNFLNCDAPVRRTLRYSA